MEVASSRPDHLPTLSIAVLKQDGVHSSYVEVTSGVPLGSVLGPMLFLLYINDINNAITSQIKPFADDSVLYRNIRNQNDQVIL